MIEYKGCIIEEDSWAPNNFYIHRNEFDAGKGPFFSAKEAKEYIDKGDMEQQEEVWEWGGI